MRYILLLFLSAMLFSTTPVFAAKNHTRAKTTAFLQEKYKTFPYLLELMQKRKVKTIVETSTLSCKKLEDIFSKGEASRIIFADWANTHKAQFICVDMNTRSSVNSLK